MFGARATVRMPVLPPTSPTTIQGRRMPHRDVVRSLSRPKNGLLTIDSSDPTPVTRARFRRGVLQADQVIDLERQRHQQRSEEEQCSAGVRQAYSETNGPPDAQPGPRVARGDLRATAGARPGAARRLRSPVPQGEPARHQHGLRSAGRAEAGGAVDAGRSGRDQAGRAAGPGPHRRPAPPRRAARPGLGRHPRCWSRHRRASARPPCSSAGWRGPAPAPGRLGVARRARPRRVDVLDLPAAGRRPGGPGHGHGGPRAPARRAGLDRRRADRPAQRAQRAARRPHRGARRLPPRRGPGHPGRDAVPARAPAAAGAPRGQLALRPRRCPSRGCGHVASSSRCAPPTCASPGARPRPTSTS